MLVDPNFRARGVTTVLAAALLAIGCGGGEAPPGGAQREQTGIEVVDTPPGVPSAPRPDTPQVEAPAPPGGGSGQTSDAGAAGWTAGETVRPRPGSYPARQVGLRAARHDGFERVVFEFEEGRLPGYHIEYVDRPIRQCGSGDAVAVAGDGWLEVRFEPAYAHTEEGRPTITARSQRPNLPNLKQLELTCDFEAHVTWVLGVGSPNRYRVLELRDPARLVVDVRS
jgi:hypothetical protein